MNENKQLQEWSEIDCDTIDFDDLEQKLKSEIEEQMFDLEILESDKEKIGSPDTLGEAVMNVVWEQFINQVGVIAGKDFIEENRNLTLDLRNSAHVQSTENFKKGKIATHNHRINFQERYEDQQKNFRHDENGRVVTHQTRSGEDEPTLVSGARAPYDKNRPTGSVEKGTDMDHTVSAGELIRDSGANAHMTEKERIDFANSDTNLNEMPAAHNRSKGDKKTSDWLDKPNKNGQKANEVLDMSEEQEVKYREKDVEARADLEKRIKEGERKSIETGKQTQKEEAFRIGGKAIRAVIMGLLASLIKDVIRKLIAWFRAGNRKLNTFIESVKEAIKSFISNMKEHLKNAGNTLVTSIATAILGPIIGMIKKAWIFLKQGYKSVKEAINFLKNPLNKNMPFNIKMLEVGKIVIVGLTAGGAIVLSEVIEKSLMSIPGFAFEIPLIGSLANLLGMFLGALTSGLIGALALNLIDKAIASKLHKLNIQQQIDKKNEIIKTQGKLTQVVIDKFAETREQAKINIQARHTQALGEISSSIQNIMNNSEYINQSVFEITEIIDENEIIIESENTEGLNIIFSDLEDLKN